MRRHRIIRTRGQRIAWTNASRLPDRDVDDAIRFVAREVDLDRVIVHFKKQTRSGYRGWAYSTVPSITNVDGLVRREWRYLITVQDAGTGLIDAGIVSTLAHEGKHVEQYRENLSRSEVRCNIFGAWVADRWSAAVADLTLA